MKITTWNINSIRRREPLAADFLTRERPDHLLLQEIKCEDHQFPALPFTALDYTPAVVGQKSYNGVATLSHIAAEIIQRKLPGTPDTDTQARFLEIRSQDIIIANLYLPNGNSGGDAGYAYKLHWMAALRTHAQTLLDADQDFILAGDFNVAPTDADYATGALTADNALARPPTRAAYRALLWLGLTDAMRALHPTETLYTFWDYTAGCWDRNIGMRIDHFLLSPRLAERLKSVTIHKAERAKPQPSDHVPVSLELS